MPILNIMNIKKYFYQGEIVTKALDGVHFTVDVGEFVAIVGTSGSGKTTLLNIMGGLDRPSSGKILINGEDLSLKKENELTIFRRRYIGFVFQHYNLVSVLNVKDNIILPIKLDGNKVDQRFFKEVVTILGIDHKLDQFLNTLSGGQQQRVAIARALITKPQIVLADEPTGNLDTKTSEEVMALLKMTSEKLHQTLIVITHNDAIAQLADRIIRIEDGKIEGDK